MSKQHVLAALLIALSSTASTAAAIDKHGPGSWAEHGAIAALLTYPSMRKQYRWWATGAVCAGFLAREMTQRGGAFNDLDSNMDWVVPCAVSAGVSIIPIVTKDGGGVGISIPLY